MSDPTLLAPAPSAARGNPTYRAFQLKPDGGVRSVEILVAASDEEACAIADAMASVHGIELWERARFLGRFEPRVPSDPRDRSREVPAPR